MTTPLPTPGTIRHGFRVLDVTPVPELNLTLVRLHHQRTGARMVHLACADRNNLFAVGFRTPPSDSSGIAHILEHTTLCGSQRFPVRDPFFAMTRRSLNTFMNAMTASDWTFYPFASQNEQDFRNLQSIYLDAVFFPLLRESDFRQEGHRLEFTDPDDPTTPLIRRGVVYNEMQGAMASPSSLLSRRTSRALYPATTYRFNSGGEPGEIPTLTWSDLQQFHRDFYHPSNSWFFTYGDLPLEEHLQRIEGEALGCFAARPVASAVPAETRLDAPRRVREPYPVDPGEPCERKTFVQVAWLTCDVADSFERLALTLLSSLLLGNPAAPLTKALLDSRLGEQLTPGCGYQDDNRTTAFMAGLQGCAADAVDAVEALILATLEKVEREGFSSERIEGAIHRLEFEHREVAGNGYPYPLALLFRMVGPWLHNDDPLSPLLIGAHLDRLRREIAAGPFLQQLIRRYLLDNRHRVTLVLAPDPAMRQREAAAQQAELAGVRSRLTPAECEALVAAARTLREEQEQPQNLDLLPTLHPDDIPRDEVPLPPQPSPGYAHHFAAPTNGIGYVVGHFPATAVAAALRPLLPLWCAVAPQVGAGGYSWTAMAERIEAETGGVGFSAEILDDPATLERFRPAVAFRAKALLRNRERLSAILSDICAAPNFNDPERLRTLLGQIRANLENSVVGSGHSYAARAAAAQLTPAARQREEWGGLSLLRRLRTLSDPAQIEVLAADLAAISAALIEREALRLGVVAEEGGLDAFAAPFATLRERLPTRGGEMASGAAPPLSERTPRGFVFNTPVNFVARVWRTVPYTDPDGAALTVLSRLLRATWLHREIREKGGAYGGLAGYDATGGLFSLLSYRDPQLSRTLKVYDDGVAWAASGGFSASDLDEALLAVFADLDRPLTPGGRGCQEFDLLQQGLTFELRQQRRQRLLAVTRDDLVRVSELYLLKGRGGSAVAVIGSEEALLRANAELGDEALAIERI